MPESCQRTVWRTSSPSACGTDETRAPLRCRELAESVSDCCSLPLCLTKRSPASRSSTRPSTPTGSRPSRSASTSHPPTSPSTSRRTWQNELLQFSLRASGPIWRRPPTPATSPPSSTAYGPTTAVSGYAPRSATSSPGTNTRGSRRRDPPTPPPLARSSLSRTLRLPSRTSRTTTMTGTEPGWVLIPPDAALAQTRLTASRRTGGLAVRVFHSDPRSGRSPPSRACRWRSAAFGNAVQ